MDIINIKVDKESCGKRLDKFLNNKIDKFSRSKIQKLIHEKNIIVNNKIEKSNYKIKENDILIVHIPQPKPLKLAAEDIPLDILHEDEEIIIVNKPSGMVVHPAPGNYEGTLVNALLNHCDRLPGINGITRPGIVHRIDKDTSGVLVVAKTENAHHKISAQIKEHSIERVYIALVHGIVQEPGGTINTLIGRSNNDRKKMAVKSQGGKNAITYYKVKERFTKGYTYIEAKLETGRTHQIRVHMSYIGHPVVGDLKYGPKKPHFKLTGQLLHAAELGFIHPSTNQFVHFSAPLPKKNEKILEKLRI